MNNGVWFVIGTIVGGAIGFIWAGLMSAGKDDDEVADRTDKSDADNRRKSD